MSDNRTSPGVSSMGRTKSRMSDFLCDLRFRNELPDPSAKMKLLSLKRDPDRYCKYRETSLEKHWKPQLYGEPLLEQLLCFDLNLFNRPKGERIPLDPEDEELLRDDDPVIPTQMVGITKKERPTEESISWLLKTQYISPLMMDTTKQSLTERQGKEFQESQVSDLEENLNTREQNIQAIMASFEASKSKPVNKMNHLLQPKRILPLLPFLDRYDGQFLLGNFSGSPTADSEISSKLNAEDPSEHEHRAIMKYYEDPSLDKEQPDKFSVYMVPSTNKLEKDMHEGNEDVSYSWVQDQSDAPGDSVSDDKTFLLVFGESDVKYLPLQRKLVLREKRASEGLEHIPKTVAVSRRSEKAEDDV